MRKRVRDRERWSAGRGTSSSSYRGRDRNEASKSSSPSPCRQVRLRPARSVRGRGAARRRGLRARLQASRVARRAEPPRARDGVGERRGRRRPDARLGVGRAAPGVHLRRERRRRRRGRRRLLPLACLSRGRPRAWGWRAASRGRRAGERSRRPGRTMIDGWPVVPQLIPPPTDRQLMPAQLRAAGWGGVLDKKK